MGEEGGWGRGWGDEAAVIQRKGNCGAPWPCPAPTCRIVFWPTDLLDTSNGHVACTPHVPDPHKEEAPILHVKTQHVEFRHPCVSTKHRSTCRSCGEEAPILHVKTQHVEFGHPCVSTKHRSTCRSCAQNNDFPLLSQPTPNQAGPRGGDKGRGRQTSTSGGP